MSRKLLIFGVVVTLMVSCTPLSSFALDEQYLDMFSQNDILFYDPSCSSGGVSVCDMNLIDEAVEKLEGAGVKEKAEENMERYKYAEEKTGIPWQALAALHYKEGGMNPQSTILNGESLYAHTNVDGQYVSADPNEDAVNAANHFKNNAKAIYGVELSSNSSIEDWGNAFLAYNRGQMYKCSELTWRDSPYVMNFSDSEHMNMVWNHWDSYDSCEKKHDGNPGRKYNSVEGTVDSNVGTLVVFAYLCGEGGGSSSGLSSSSDGSNVTIIGDSITVGSEAEIKKLLPESDIHAKISKRFYDGTSDNPGGITILKELVNSKKLRNVLVYALGTNNADGVTEKQVQEVLDLAGNSKVIFVTNYTTKYDYIGNNNNFMKAKEDNEGSVFVADWKSLIENKTSDYLERDGTHPNAKGQELFAKVISDTVNEALNISSPCGDNVNGGLTEEQAQEVADYYNGSKVNADEWGLPHGKKNCVSFSAFFIQRFTSIGKQSGRTWGDGYKLAHKLAEDFNLPEGKEAKPFAVFSTTKSSTMCGPVPCGHTGIVVAVNGDDITTIEASYGLSDGEVVQRDIGYFENIKYGYTFTYLDSVLNKSEIAKVFGS